ncbi:NFACT RNA binding domain-containing protein [Agrilactobacillus fermenti]|uniref:NFACT RNA binding domain-containing protein n=1 Tax=Agrilactobacillus fermenti TaxID=2586909 RepID=UPI001E2F95B2|nr:NFACT RNA binding domain-containing protein [Agrilactobacillus fermenti]MCD2256578.1 NFACT family protein [Agrilactobacillus fermenti]
MSFDGAFTHAMVAELVSTIQDGKLNKIQQPYENEVILTVRKNRKNQMLLLSAHPSYARIQTTKIPYSNPAVPTKFVMTLRKYLDGAVIKSITQQHNDRIIHFTFTSRNELGDLQNLQLIVELMGRHSNIFLIDLKDHHIIDLVKHVPASENSFRGLMPGAIYQQPPYQDKLDPFQIEPATLERLAIELQQTDRPVQLLQHKFQGLGHDTASELIYQIKEKNISIWSDFFHQYHQPRPTLYENSKKSYFTPFTFTSFEVQTNLEAHTFGSLSELLDAYYAQKAQKDRVKQQGSELIHFINTELHKDRKKLKKLQQTLAVSENADELRIKGEILTTYLHELHKGMTEVSLPNFYDNEAPLKIGLSNQLTPSENAQKYFSRYQKLKNSVAYVTEQMRLTQAEIDYFEGILAQIDLAEPKDLADIKLELQREGYLHIKKKQKGKPAKVSQPEIFHAADGTKILVGKNNLQNDELTLKKAKKTDTWLHAKNVPGSHVIIASDQPSDETLVQAATLAAYYSKSRLSGTVPVDYVQVKKVHKPNGAKPGFVIYEGQKTLFVTPSVTDINKMRL